MAKAMLNGELMFPTKYVSAEECKGKDVTLTIADVKIDELQRKDGGKEKKPVLYFKETKKMLVLNKTNSGAIADQLGTEARKWPGHRITIFPTTCNAYGEIKPCIRIRPASKRAQQSAPPQSDEPQPVERDADGNEIPPM